MLSYCRPQTVKRQLTSRWEAAEDVDAELQGVIRFHHASMERACYRADPDRRGAVPMADPGELDVSCLNCHHNMTMPVAVLLPRYAAETPFPEVWGGFRCSACGSKRIDVRPHWAARQATGQITPP
jgi:hypothetical protein